jgi:hypothetical protein
VDVILVAAAEAWTGIVSPVARVLVAGIVICVRRVWRGRCSHLHDRVVAILVRVVLRACRNRQLNSSTLAVLVAV